MVQTMRFHAILVIRVKPYIYLKHIIRIRKFRSAKMIG